VISLIFATWLVSKSGLKLASPVVAGIKGFVVDPIVQLSIDGKQESDFGLSMTTRHSIVVNKDDAGLARKLTVNGKEVATAELESPGDGAHPVLNALGLTVLNGMAIGIDYAKNQITFWPGGKLSEDDAKAWVMRSPKWISDATFWKTKISRRAEVAPVVPVNIDGKQLELLLRIGKEGTSFAKGAEPDGGTSIEYGPGGNQALIGNVGVGPTTLPWALYFRGVSYDPRKAIDSNIVGTLTTDDLLSRRVIVDLAGGQLYAEQLPKDAQMSMFLTEWFQLPLEVQGNKILIREMPGTHFFAQLSPIYDSEVLEIMGQPAESIIGAANDFSGEHRLFLKVLFEKVWRGFKVKIKRPNGDVTEVSFDPPK